MNTNCSDKLKNHFESYLKKLDRKAYPLLGVRNKKIPSFWPAVSIGCEYRSCCICDSSGKSVSPQCHISLRKELEKLGPIGVKVSGCDSINGSCAEDRSADRVLEKWKMKHGEILTLDKLVFTPAVRARTRKVVKPCANCKKVFK